MASTSALKNKPAAKKAVAKKATPAKKAVAKKAVTAKKVAPAKKAVAKKAVAKKAAPVKKVAAPKPEKIEYKKVLDASDVQQILDLMAKNKRHAELVEIFDKKKINYRSNKEVTADLRELAQEARKLDAQLEKDREALKAAKLKIKPLSKAELALVAPKPEPEKIVEITDAPVEKGAKAVVLDEDGNEIVVEEVEIEDVDALIAEAAEIIDAEADGGKTRVVDVTEEKSKFEEGSFLLLDSESDDDEF